MGSESDPDNAGVAADTEVIGYIYHPGGRGSQAKVETYLVEEVAHWAPVPDPEAAFRGMSWLVPVIREVAADREMAKHQIKFFEQGATPNMVVSYGLDIEPEQFDAWVKAFKADHEGTVNAYKTLFLAGGANVEVVGANLKDVDFSQVKGHGETRIAAAAGVPPIIAGFSEGLQAATYSNYGQARRRFADLTMRPLWEGMAGALETIVDVPDDQTELWYDVRDVFFLQEDEQDRANIQQTQAQAARTYIDAGYNPDSVIAALEADDITRLVHSGLFSVQLQKAGAVDGDMADDDDDPPILDNGDRELGRSALAALAEMLRER
jgi:phage portal protein BeeE